MTDLRIRKAAKKLAYRSRFKALSSKEQVQLRRYKNCILAFMIKAKAEGKTAQDLDIVPRALIARYLHMIVDTEEDVERRFDFKRTISSFRPSECYINFRFKKAALTRLLPLLRFPAKCVLQNRSTMSGEEVLLRGLYEFSSGDMQEKIAANVFGSEYTRQGRAFKYFIDHIFDNFQHLVTDNLDW